MNTQIRIMKLMIAMFALFAGQIRAGDLYVSPAGSQSGGISWSTAYTNLQDALQVASPGDTIHMAGAIYSLTNRIAWTSSQSNITVRGGYAAAGDEILPGNINPTQWPTVVTTAGTSHRLVMLNGVQNGTIENITFTGARNIQTTGADARGAALSIESSTNIRVSNCVISNNYAESTNSGQMCLGGGIYVGGSQLVLDGCLLDGNSVKSAGGSSSCGGAVAYDVGSNCSFIDCVFTRNMLLFAGNDCIGGAVYQSANTSKGFFKNCLMVGNVAMPPYWGASNGEGVYCKDGMLSMTNCTVAYNTGDGVYRKAGTVRLDNSIVFGHKDDVSGTVSLNHCLTGDGDNAGSNGCLQGDPVFTHGFYLGAGSVARDAGDQPVAGTIFTNLTTLADGTFDDGTVDLGYHYNVAAPTIPDTLYVATTGSDANNGLTESTPLESITKALALAGDQTVIQIGPGHYSTVTTGETFPVEVKRRYGLAMIGAPDGGTVIDAIGNNARVMKVVDCGGLCFSNLTFTGGHETTAAGLTIFGAGVFLEHVADTTISHCQITNNFCNKTGGAQQHVWGGGVAIGVCADVTMANTIVSGNRTSNNWGFTYGLGVCVLDCSRVYLKNSQMTDNYAMVPCNGNLGGGLYVSAGRSKVQVENCLFARNRTIAPKGKGDGVYVEKLKVSSHSVSFQSCTIADNEAYGLYRADGTVSLLNTIIWNNGTDVSGTISASYCNIGGYADAGANGNLSKDPMFRAPEKGDYTLRALSPSVDTGLMQAWMETGADLAGNPRVIGHHCDMGCYECTIRPGTFYMLH